MERSFTQDANDTADARTHNEDLAYTILQSAIDCGIEEFCICPGGRNAPLIASLATQDFLKCYWGFEERSTAFFALGRIKRTNKPVAVIVTSGTAVGEVLPAVMEAYYTCQPLLVISADRPTRFRGSGAPQACTQPGIFGIYAPFLEDLSGNQTTSLHTWDQRSPAQLNVCFEEPKDLPGKVLSKPKSVHTPTELPCQDIELDRFLEQTNYPLVIVGEVAEQDRDSVEEFLLKLNAPIIAEPPSGLNGRSALKHLQISRRYQILETASRFNYPIDGVLRLGGVPTLRLWRDLENLGGKIPVLSLSRWPFSGLSFNAASQVALGPFLESYVLSKQFQRPEQWHRNEKEYLLQLAQLYQKFPHAEQTLFHQLSLQLPKQHSLYLGNSLPIRQWDLFAAHNHDEVSIAVNRGLNGIDGQLSTALGFADKNQENWVILGDLTTLYDLSAPWFLKQLPFNIQFVVVNNSGGQIFSEMYKNPAFLNQHSIQFQPFAAMWNMEYEQWKSIPISIVSDKSRVIELIPDPNQTKEFWKFVKYI